jgi:hypothetical protein
MLLIQDILVSDEVVKSHFVCRLDACKGACCWEGDYGAPLEVDELPILERIFTQVRPFLTPEGIAVIEKEGTAVYNENHETYATPLVNNGPCAYMTRDEKGIAHCGIEQAWKAGAVDFQKPISCHLYPIRVSVSDIPGFEALNYDRWDICNAACSYGAQLQVPIYQFVKDALVRKYGQDFYDELYAAAQGYE